MTTVLITGATGTIGYAIAERIAAEPGHEVVLVCRDAARGEAAAAHIRKTSGNAAVRCEVADLSRRASIEALAARWQGPLHVLVNNAAATPRERLETPEGIELQLATNVLGYFWMMRALTEILQRSAPARVVNVASYWAGGLDLDDLEFVRRPYDNDAAYRQSKQADRMLSVAFAERLAPHGITVNACHPGDVRSRLSADLGFGGHESPQEAASTPVYLALGAEGGRVTGGWFEHHARGRCRFADDRPRIAALYDACEAYG